MAALQIVPFRVGVLSNNVITGYIHPLEKCAKPFRHEAGEQMNKTVDSSGFGNIRTRRDKRKRESSWTIFIRNSSGLKNDSGLLKPMLNLLNVGNFDGWYER